MALIDSSTDTGAGTGDRVVDSHGLGAHLSEKIQALRRAGYRVVVDEGTSRRLVVGAPDGIEPPTTRLTLDNGSLVSTLIRGVCEVAFISPRSTWKAAVLLVSPVVITIAAFFLTGGSSLFVAAAGLSGALWILACASGTEPAPERRYTLTPKDRAKISSAAS